MTKRELSEVVSVSLKEVGYDLFTDEQSRIYVAIAKWEFSKASPLCNYVFVSDDKLNFYIVESGQFSLEDCREFKYLYFTNPRDMEQYVLKFSQESLKQSVFQCLSYFPDWRGYCFESLLLTKTESTNKKVNFHFYQLPENAKEISDTELINNISNRFESLKKINELMQEQVQSLVARIDPISQVLG